jgi:hypothetical protein
MGIIRRRQYDKQNHIKKIFDISIDLDCLGTIKSDNTIVFHPCRLNAVNTLYEKGHKIIIFTSKSKNDIIIESIKNLKYHKIIFDHVECDFIVSNAAREQTPFFNELFDRNYDIKPLKYLTEYYSN